MRCRPFYIKSMCAIALAAACALMSGCGIDMDILPSVTSSPLPVVTATLPESTTSQVPESTPYSYSNNSQSAGYSYLDGVAGQDDVLPDLTYSEAKEQNGDTIGYISVPGTGIEYPVVRGNDNEYYLSHNILGDESKYGAIFMDFRNADKNQQKHIIIYGHDMKNGTMFHGLLNFKQKSFFSENRIISFKWGETETMWEIYLACTIPTVDGHIINYTETRFSDNAAFEEYMIDMVAYARTAPSSTLSDNTTVSQADQVLTLTTCTYEEDGSRFIIQARRVR